MCPTRSADRRPDVADPRLLVRCGSDRPPSAVDPSTFGDPGLEKVADGGEDRLDISGTHVQRRTAVDDVVDGAEPDVAG